ncbi:MAG: 2-(1,2-epoxy-1,2-dihydrophenyl)acetyl-CoA isomerase [Acidobacteria bacterium]|nr:MAG: 2-(1,2-epoxy-1,2-dihydrophenyl)acetyl-CoA isomerase [Acidobacteriota bacterium]
MAYESIRYERRDAVARIVLDRPKVLNSFDRSMAKELQAALDDAESDPAVRSVLLTGAGRAFCAGQDLAEALPEQGEAPPIDGIVRESYNPLVLRIVRGSKPVVCAVNGVAAGAGANLALACDFVIAAEEAVFIQAFVRIGLVPDTGGTYLLPRLAGLARARALAMLGERLPARQAFEWGLIHEVCPAGELEERSFALARRLAAMPTRALGMIKEAFAESLGNDLESQLELEARLQAEAARTGDFAEGVRAFREKREPRFSGT